MMKNKTIWTRLLMVLSFLAVNISFAQKPHNPRIFEKEIIVFEKSDEEQMRKPDGIVFTGSSSIRRWNSLEEDFPDRNVVNRGFGGSRIGDATFYFERIISKYNPVQVVLYSGENDIVAGKTPEMVFDKFKEFYYKMKVELPNSELVFISMKPSLALWEMYPDIQKSNKLIENFINQNNKVQFVDISSAMIEKDGKPIPDLFVDDGLHLTPKGYLLWNKILEPYLGFSMISCKNKESGLNTENFPKTELKVTEMPKKENVWVFMLAGQSNMAGRGFIEPEDTIHSKRIFTINKNNTIILAKEPIHFYEPSMTGLDIGLSFGKELIKIIPDSISILIIPTAVGGSSINQWLQDEKFRNVQLLTNFLEKLEIGKTYGTIKGVVWHQGENDAINPTDIEKYKERLSNLLLKFRTISANKNLPIIIGELGSFSENKREWNSLNNQIRAYSSTDSFTKVVQTNDLEHKGDNLHFNSESLRILGKRYAEKFLE